LYGIMTLMGKDYYNILGVEKKASKDDIKKAFHKLAHKYHPDKNGGDEVKFKEINEAYQILSDDNKRAQYDQFGSDFAQGSHGGQNSQQGGGFSDFDFSQFTQGGGFDMGDIFGDLFGGSSRRAKNRRGADLQTNISLDFKESIFGLEKEIRITKPSTCNTCHGNGAKPGTELHTCDQCNGQGVVKNIQRTILGSIATTQVCSKCDGVGKIPKEACQTCNGKGVVNEARTIKVSVPAGIQNGETLRLQNMGEAIKGGQTGDLYVRVSVVPHKTIIRQNNDLVSTLSIKLTDALLGAQYAVETLDGSVAVTVPAGTKIGDTVTLKQHGVPTSSSKRGNFIVKLNISLPEKLSKHAKEVIEELKKEGI
jgi:molecular chaperone DnaJ